MGLIAQEGYYKGKVIDGGLGESTGGFPQILFSLVAEEIYDLESEQYVPADPEANQINYYGVLYDSKDKETRNSKQLKKVTKWDGASFVELANMNFADLPIQFRVEPHTYQENTTLQVTWIDEPGASPIRGVNKLDAEGVKALHTKYAGILAQTKAAPKPVSAPVKPVSSTPSTKPTEKPEQPKKRGRPSSKPTPPKKSVGKCTADEAWAACVSLKKDEITEDKLSEIWTQAIVDTTGSIDTPDEDITPEQWYQIKEDVLRQVGKV
jgi:cell division septation protein DedD